MTELEPGLGFLTAKPESAMAFMFAELRGLKDAVLSRIDAADLLHREFATQIQMKVEHESSNRKMADEALRSQITALDAKKVVEKPHLDALDARYHDGMKVVTKTVDRLDCLEDKVANFDAQRRALLWIIGGAFGVAATAGGVVLAGLQLLHH